MSTRTGNRTIHRKRVVFFLSMLLWGLGMVFGVGGAVAWAENDDALSAVFNLLRNGVKPVTEAVFDKTEQPTVYLTFDDGPSKLTPKVLDILKEEGVKATFFMLGREAEQRPDTVKRVAEEGHAIGNHTYNHVYNELYSRFDRFWDQVQQTEGILEGLIGYKPQLLRAPGGTATNFDAFYWYDMQQAGYAIFDWNIDSGDSKRVGVPAKEIISTVRSGPFPKEAVILMHDGTGHDETVKALPEIIRIFKEKGYAFATLSPSTKPVQFSLKPIKWSRSATSYEAFSAAVGQAQEHAAVFSPPVTPEAAPEPAVEPEPEPTPTPITVQTPAPTATPTPSLTVSVDKGGGVWTLLPGEYEFRQERFAVPLSGLAAKLGGSVHWDSLHRTVTLHCGLYMAEYDFAKLQLREFKGGRQVRVTHLSDARLLPAGDVLVPLRAQTEAVGGRVSGYSLKPDERLVTIAAAVSVPLPELTFAWSAKPAG